MNCFLCVCCWAWQRTCVNPLQLAFTVHCHCQARLYLSFVLWTGELCQLVASLNCFEIAEFRKWSKLCLCLRFRKFHFWWQMNKNDIMDGWIRHLHHCIIAVAVVAAAEWLWLQLCPGGAPCIRADCLLPHSFPLVTARAGEAAEASDWSRVITWPGYWPLIGHWPGWRGCRGGPGGQCTTPGPMHSLLKTILKKIWLQRYINTMIKLTSIIQTTSHTLKAKERRMNVL